MATKPHDHYLTQPQKASLNYEKFITCLAHHKMAISLPYFLISFLSPSSVWLDFVYLALVIYTDEWHNTLNGIDGNISLKAFKIKSALRVNMQR